MLLRIFLNVVIKRSSALENEDNFLLKLENLEYLETISTYDFALINACYIFDEKIDRSIYGSF